MVPLRVHVPGARVALVLLHSNKIEDNLDYMGKSDLNIYRSVLCFTWLCNVRSEPSTMCCLANPTCPNGSCCSTNSKCKYDWNDEIFLLLYVSVFGFSALSAERRSASTSRKKGKHFILLNKYEISFAKRFNMLLGQCRLLEMLIFQSSICERSIG